MNDLNVHTHFCDVTINDAHLSLPVLFDAYARLKGKVILLDLNTHRWTHGKGWWL